MSESSQQTPSITEGLGRYSSLALLAMLLSLGSVAGCFIVGGLAFLLGPRLAVGILLMPLLGLTGLVTGFIALRRIRRSNGALRGHGFALVGIFVGLMSAVLQGSMSLAAVGKLRTVQVVLAPAVDQFIKDATAGKREPTRRQLAESTNSTLSNERLDLFFDELRARCGEPLGATAQLTVFLRAAAAVRSAPNARTTSIQQDKYAPDPVELLCANDTPLCYVFLDNDALNQGLLRIIDLLVILPGGESLTLLPAGPAKETADALGFKVVN